jgi:2-amino-4-hydroxy-6-hydroxymethyldihydropteridine diphosphokinase
MNTAILGIGSNIRPDDHIPMVKKLLLEKVDVLLETDFIQTKPLGYLEQDDFINGALLIKTDMEHEALNDWLKSLEKQLGRKPQENRNGPRPIDLDILVWNEEICDEAVVHCDFVKDFVNELLPKKA